MTEITAPYVSRAKELTQNAEGLPASERLKRLFEAE